MITLENIVKAHDKGLITNDDMIITVYSLLDMTPKDMRLDDNGNKYLLNRYELRLLKEIKELENQLNNDPHNYR